MMQHVGSVLTLVRKGAGLCLVLAAMSAMAHANPPVLGTPEIDPGSMLSGLAMVSAGLLMVADRRRRK